MTPLPVFLLSWFALFCGLLTASGQPAPAHHDQLLAEARAFADEQSWTLAAERFQTALDNVPADQDPRPIQLDLLTATIRAEPMPADWQLRSARIQRHREAFDTLLRPYREGAPYDDFGIAVVEALLEVGPEAGMGRPTHELVAAALRLADEPATPDHAKRLIGFLQRQLQNFESNDGSLGQLATVFSAITHGDEFTPEQQAWAALALTRLPLVSSQPAASPRVTADWERARSLARGTRIEPLAEAMWFEWEFRHGWDPEGESPRRDAFPAMIAEARRLIAALDAAEAPYRSDAWRTRLVDLTRAWLQPHLKLTTRDDYRTAELVEFVYAVTNYPSVRFELYRIPIQAFRPSPYFSRSRRTVPEGQLLLSWEEKFDDVDPHVWHSRVAQLDHELPAGCYVLVATTGDESNLRRESAQFMVSDIEAITVFGPHGLSNHELLLTDRLTGEPLANVEVAVRVSRDPGIGNPVTLTTDADGRIGELSLPGTGSHYSALFVGGEANGQPFAIGTSHWYPSETLDADIIVDRPLYQPGESVNWRLVLRERRDADWHIPSDRWTLTFVSDEGDEVAKYADVMLDQAGAFDGSFAIPATFRPGSITVRINSPQRYQTTSIELCEVDNFRPPALTGTIAYAGAPDGLRPGGEAVARVAVNYLSGGPAVACPVTLRVTPGNEMEATTDDRGLAVFRWRLPASGNGRLTLEANILPVGGQPVQQVATWQIPPKGLLAEIEGQEQPGLVAPDDTVRLAGRVLNGAGTPVAAPAVAELRRVAWIGAYLTEDNRVVDQRALPADLRPGVLPSGWTRLREAYASETVASLLIDPDDSGTFAVEFPLPGSGLYRLRVVDEDGQELPAPQADTMNRRQPIPHRAFDIVAADSTTAQLPIQPGASHFFAPRELSAGDAFDALLIGPRADETLIMAIGREVATHTRRLPLSGRLVWLDLSAETATAGAGQVQVIETNGNRLLQHDFTVHPDQPPLTVTLEVPESARPGQTVPVKITATDIDARPVPASLTFAAADEAVLGLVPHQRKFGESFRHPRLHGGFNLASSRIERRGKFTAFRDPRLGTAWRDFHGGGGYSTYIDEEDVVVLSPFEVSAADENQGYAAATTLAGNRLNTELRDLGNAVTVITSQFLADIAATDNASMLQYTTGTEVGNVPGNFAAAAPIRIRRHFASTAGWVPAVTTDENGQAEIPLTLPDNLTDWRLTTHAIGLDGASFATATAHTTTDLPFQVRLQAPRFLVAGDTTTPSVVLVNRTADELNARVALDFKGDAVLQPDARVPLTATVPARGDARVDWQLQASETGDLRLAVIGAAGSETDAMVTTLPVIEDGLLQHTAASTRLTTDERSGSLRIALPTVLDPERTSLRLQLNSDPALFALDALPYLVDYPYGCVEQTMSRFLPAVVVRGTLTRLGLDPAEVEARLLKGESAADVRRRLGTAGLSRLDEVVAAGLARLAGAQTPRGGFGWWPGAHQDDPWMTAYVAWGLALASEAGADVPSRLLNNTMARCVQFAADESIEPDFRAWALAALATGDGRWAPQLAPGTVDSIFAERDVLTPSGRAALGLGLAHFGSDEQRAIITRNLANKTVSEIDDAWELIHWGQTQNYWRALNGATEATAMSVLALLELDPENALVEPAIGWLALNRRSAHWNSTRDTALAVLALTRRLTRDAAETDEATFAISVNGRRLETVTLSANDLLGQPVTVSVPVNQLRPGDNQVDIRRVRGKGRLYATALAEAWATGDAVQPAGYLIDVSRELIRRETTPTLLGQLRITPVPLTPGRSVLVGDQIDARLTVTLPHDLSYVMIKVPKPAGSEPLNPLSGWDATIRRVLPDAASPVRTGARPIYREEHDDHSAFFIDALEAGTWEVQFGLRAVTAGDYRVLPAEAEAMYVPEIHANSDARRVQIERTP